MGQANNRGTLEQRTAQALELMKDKEVIRDVNGGTILVPREPDKDTPAFLKQVEDSLEIYAVDNCLYPQGDVVSVQDGGFMTMISFKNHNNPSDPVKHFNCLTNVIEQMKEAIHEMNFSSWEAFKTNLLPYYNGPDNACFIGKPFSGVNIGFKFSIPNAVALS